MASGPRALRIAALRDAIDRFWLEPDRDAVRRLRHALRVVCETRPHETLADVLVRVDVRYHALMFAVEAAAFAS